MEAGPRKAAAGGGERLRLEGGGWGEGKGRGSVRGGGEDTANSLHFSSEVNSQANVTKSK